MYPYPPSSHPSFSLLSLASRTRPFQHLPPSSNLSPVSLRPFPSPSRRHPCCLDSRHYTCGHHHLHLTKSSHARRFPVSFMTDPRVTIHVCLPPSSPQVYAFMRFLLIASLPCISLLPCLVLVSQIRVDTCSG